MARVFVVEDDPDVRQVYTESLREAGYDVIEARDGSEAMHQMDAAPAVVILDLVMPGTNGYEFLEELRSRRGHQSVPVIAVSGAATGKWSLRVGADKFLAKPFDPETLMQLVRSYTSP